MTHDLDHNSNERFLQIFCNPILQTLNMNTSRGLILKVKIPLSMRSQLLSREVNFTQGKVKSSQLRFSLDNVDSRLVSFQYQNPFRYKSLQQIEWFSYFSSSGSIRNHEYEYTQRMILIQLPTTQTLIVFRMMEVLFLTAWNMLIQLVKHLISRNTQQVGYEIMIKS